MLTKLDLQQIGDIIEEKLKPIDQKVTGLDQKVTGLDQKVTRLEKSQKALGRTVNKVAKEQQIILGFLNKEDTELRKRVDNIEDFVGLSSR